MTRGMLPGGFAELARAFVTPKWAEEVFPYLSGMGGGRGGDCLLRVREKLVIRGLVDWTGRRKGKDESASVPATVYLTLPQIQCLSELTHAMCMDDFHQMLVGIEERYGLRTEEEDDEML